MTFFLKKSAFTIYFVLPTTLRLPKDFRLPTWPMFRYLSIDFLVFEIYDCLSVGGICTR